MNNRKEFLFRARKLRKNMTPEEKRLWRYLKNRSLAGFKFLRQHPIIYESINGKHYYYIADFYCAENRLIVELDGAIHNENKQYDLDRDLKLRELGYKVIRFDNQELRKIDIVLEKILVECRK